MPPTLPSEGCAQNDRYDADRSLARDILSGDVGAWHRFVDRFGALILCVVRRHARSDSDETRTIFVDVLDHLYRRGLAAYRGQASLATWLVVVSRSVALDHVRRRQGRSPHAIKRLAPLDRKILELHHRRGMSFQVILATLHALGHDLKLEDVKEAVERIEHHVDGRTLRRFAYHSRAKSVGLSNGRLLEFLDHCRAEDEVVQKQRTPLQDLIEREARERATRIRAMVENLPAEERAAIHGHVLEGRTAIQVAADLGLAGPRRLYTVVERALRRLRRWAETGDSVRERIDEGPR